jgi:hypothetical protein
MRIGQITQDNYKEYLKILGIKDVKKLDGLLGKDKNTDGFDQFGQRIGDYSHEAQEARMVAAGYGQEGMLVREGDTSWKKIIPVSDDIKSHFIEVARRQFLTNGDGRGYARDGDEIGALLNEYRKSVPPSERLSFTYTINQMLREENMRLMDFVKANVPGWTHGQAIPSDVLKGAVSGGLDIKV